MSLLTWLTFVQSLATAYATSQGVDIRALGYLRVATGLVTGQQPTDAELQALMDEYTAKVAGQTPTTAEELQELDARLAARSAAIQSV
jgi:hypothetical protein